MEIKTIARKWGNSIAIIIPKIMAESKRIRENEEITIEIKKRINAKDFFGILPGMKKSGQEIKNEMKKGW